MAQTAGLPQEILRVVLEKLDQRQLMRCCLVSQSWRELSLRALTSLELEITSRTKDRLKGFKQWLERRGNHLKSLHIHALQSTVLELALAGPQPQLQQLVIRRARLATSNRIGCLTGLTDLQLLDVFASPQLLASLASLGNLRSLRLENMDFGPIISSTSRDSFATRCNKMLGALVQLTQLTLQHCDLCNAAVQEVSGLRQLCHLDLSGNQLQAPTIGDISLSLPRLPPSLSHLNLSSNHLQLDISPLLAVNALPGLQHLGISQLTLVRSPSCLAALTGLTRLDAGYVVLFDAGELVTALQQLRHLAHLELQGSFTDTSRPHTAALEHCLAQLTLLTHLNLADNRLLPPPAPAGGPPPPAVPPLLTSGLDGHPHLQVLNMSCTDLPRGQGPNFRYDGPGLQQLLSNCPRLTSLDLAGRIHHDCSDRDLLPLTHLAGLTSLVLGGKGWLLTDATLKVLAQLTGLRSLEVAEGCDVTDTGLLALTQLTALTLLLLADCYGDTDRLSEALVPLPRTDGAPRELCLQHKGSVDRAANVWQQLLTRCNNSPVCLRSRQKQLEKELSAAKKEAAQQRKRTTAAEKLAAAAQQEVRELRLQLQSLKAAPHAPEQQ